MISRIFFIAIFFLSSCGFLLEREKPIEGPLYTYPWVTWQTGETYQGQILSSRFIIRGDELFLENKLDEALQNYFLAEQELSTIDEQENLALRITGVYLAQKAPHRALDHISSFYKKIGRPVNFVSSESALVFSCIYGSLQNFSQALAWFSQSFRTIDSNLKLRLKIEDAIGLFLSKIEDEIFYALQDKWGSDEFVGTSFQRENSRRLQFGGVIMPFKNNPYFWEDRAEATDSQVSLNYIPQERPAISSKGVAIMLPLSGRYGKFGQSVKSGVELAFSGLDEPINYQFFDNAADAGKSTALCKQIVASKKYQIILGPLLLGPSQAVASCLQNSSIVQISLTKSSDFKTKARIYNFGITVEAQIDSLIKALSENLRTTRYAVMYPVEQADNKYAEYLKEVLKSKNLELSFEYKYYKNPIPDFADLNREIELYNPQVILIVDDAEVAGRVSMALGEETTSKVRLLGTAIWANTQELKMSLGALRNAIFVSPYFADNSPLSVKFNEAYRAVYNENPDILAAQGFDLANFLLGALKKDDFEYDILQSLQLINIYYGLTGDLKINSRQELIRNLKIVEITPEGLSELKQKKSPVFIYRGDNEVKKE